MGQELAAPFLVASHLGRQRAAGERCPARPRSSPDKRSPPAHSRTARIRGRPSRGQNTCPLHRSSTGACSAASAASASESASFMCTWLMRGPQLDGLTGVSTRDHQVTRVEHSRRRLAKAVARSLRRLDLTTDVVVKRRLISSLRHAVAAERPSAKGRHCGRPPLRLAGWASRPGGLPASVGLGGRRSSRDRKCRAAHPVAHLGGKPVGRRTTAPESAGEGQAPVREPPAAPPRSRDSRQARDRFRRSPRRPLGRAARSRRARAGLPDGLLERAVAARRVRHGDLDPGRVVNSRAR